MSAYDPKQSDQTITLDSSSETDIIDCSIEEIYNKNDFFKTPRSHLNRKCTSAKKNEVISLKGFQFRNENQQVQVKIPAAEKADNSLRAFGIQIKLLKTDYGIEIRRMTVGLKHKERLNIIIHLSGDDLILTSGWRMCHQRCKLWSSFKSNDSVILDDSIITSTPESTKRNENKNDEILNNFLPGLKDSPYLPYLCKSKLNRIGNWLNENDIETVTTPPFSNNKRSSQRLRKTSSARSLTKSQAKKDYSSDSSVIDPEVEKVLVAVYGKDWKAKNVLKKSKTEPKRSKKPIFSIKTDTDNKAETDLKLVRTARRNIMKTGVRRGLIKGGNSDHLDSPSSLGVGKLNESGSTDDDFIGKNFSSGRRRKILTPSSTTSSPTDDDFIGKNFSSGRRRKILTPSSTTSCKKPMVNKKKADDVKKKSERHSTNNQAVEATCSTKKESKDFSSKNETPTKSFLASLSISTPKRKCDPEAQDFKINYRSKKQELTIKLFKLYNSEVFGNQLPHDMNFSWNMKMRRTAGYCYNKKIIRSTGQVTRLSRIELSAKIVDRADRLRDTLIHELCHAASWVIDGKLDGHGSVWTKWSRKAMETFPELPPIKRCHSYQIVSKYTYKCSGCGYSVNRCSKSINTERKRCGFCFGVLELFVNKRKRGKGEIPEFKATRSAPPNNFALFIKENYQNVKSAKKDAKHAEIMKILSQKYALTKDAAKKSASKKKN